MKLKDRVQEEIGDFLCHFGWAIWGQECDCGYNPFNRLARFMQRYPDGDWDWPEGPHGRDWWIYYTGNFFVELGTNMTPMGDGEKPVDSIELS